MALMGDSDDDDGVPERAAGASGAAEVLADESSKEYDISMIQVVPSLVNRAKTMLPLSFASGIGRPYDEPDVAQAIDRQHLAMPPWGPPREAGKRQAR
jgi:hypothetical protein